MAKPEKYGHISFVPPAGVRREAARGLAMRREHGRGGTAIGIARARDLSNGTELSPSTLRRMKAFFDRHAPDRKAKGFRAGEEGFPSNGKIADLLWGGRSGESWCRKVVRQMNAADERTYSLDSETATLEEEAVLQRSAAMQGVERRYFGSFEKADDNSLSVEHRADPETGKRRTYIVGYAAKFGTDSLLLGDFIERLAPSAFDIVKAGKDKSGKPLATRCLFNHDPNHLLGRFPTTMKMMVDKIGLRYECLLPESRQDIAEMISRGDLKGSSFSFVVDEGGEKWTTENGQSIRTVTRIKSLLDCSPVTYPAYDDATVAIAKRSYEAFSAETKKAVEVRSNVASEIEKTRAFLDERRGFCPTGPGGGIDNSCGSGASNAEPDSAWREGGKVGAVIGAAVGTIGGAAGFGAGAAIGAVTGAVAGLFGKQSQAKLEAAYKSTGTDLSKIDKAAKSLGVSLTVDHSGSNIVATSKGDLAVQIKRGDDGTEVHFMSKGDPTESGLIDETHGGAVTKAIESGKMPAAGLSGKLADKFVKAAKDLNVDHVSASLYDEKSVKAFEAKGFKVVSKPEDKFSPTVVRKELPKSKSRRSYEELLKFYESRGFCPTGAGGGVDNSCGKGEGKYMEWSKGKDKEAQDFIDKARTEQLSKGGKDGGKADEGGGVQTWSKGDHFPWTVKQVGDTDGHVQGQHPDGSKTQKYPFKGGDTKEAMKKVADEIKNRKNSRADQVVADTLKFLKDRRA